MPAAVKTEGAMLFHLVQEPIKQRHNAEHGHYPARKPKDKK